ncbi:MAG TPA: TerC/Alx family metal homeostasis membrane protein [Candidatus Kapabacteria bacterium]|nr:TerC/Alx family metal homeostasis membrane protein [Candidatus Kapabacteria bacterium]
MLGSESLFWIIFSILVVIMLYIDIWVTDHRNQTITLKQSLIWTGVWIGVALLFNLSIFLFMENGHTLGVQFLSAYLVEKSLSVDNLFVFMMIFNVMGIPEFNQPHILKWGILSAVVMRVVFILAGVALLHYFHPIIYVFAIFLIYAAWKMAFGGEEKIDPDSNPIVKFMVKRFNYLHDYHGREFYFRKEHILYITPLLLTLVLIELSDLMFAIDSIPAVLAISTDPFIAITSNIFAILGLRALYFVIAGIADKFYLLKYGVAIILAYIGVKMSLVDISPIPTYISLTVILVVLSLSIILSLVFKRTEKEA